MGDQGGCSLPLSIYALCDPREQLPSSAGSRGHGLNSAMQRMRTDHTREIEWIAHAWNTS